MSYGKTMVVGLGFCTLMGMMAACGTGLPAAGYQGTPLLSLHGTLASTLPAPVNHPVHVALKWRTHMTETSWSSSTIVQDTVVTPEFPAAFQLDINDIPPDAAMTAAADTWEFASIANAQATRMAIGELVVVEDANDNGEIDMLPSTATTPIDDVVGTAIGLSVVYVEGDAFLYGDIDRLAFNPGFNLWQSPVICGGTPGCTDVSQSSMLPLDVELQITLVADASLQSTLCTDVTVDPACASGLICCLAP